MAADTANTSRPPGTRRRASHDSIILRFRGPNAHDAPNRLAPAMTAAGEVAVDEELRCRCKATTRDSADVVVERDYSLFGLLYLMWGGTSTPTAISFRCAKCAHLFEASTLEEDRIAYRA